MLAYDDLEHPAVPAIDLPADPLEPLDAAELDRVVGDAARRALATALDGLARDRATELGRTCEGPAAWSDAWLGCWARRRFLAAAHVSAAVLVDGLRCE